MHTRPYFNAVARLIDDEIISPAAIATAALLFMSEEDIARLIAVNEWEALIDPRSAIDPDAFLEIEDDFNAFCRDMDLPDDGSPGNADKVTEALDTLIATLSRHKGNA
jgi:hypothetical protein